MPSDTPTEGHRHATITPDDHGVVLQSAAWFMLVVMILATILRLLVRFTTNHIPGVDDVFVSLAMLSGVGEVVAISIATNQGLGKRADLLTPADIQDVEKSVYVSTVLYIVTIVLAKASTLTLISRLATAKHHIQTVKALSAVVISWSLAAIFGTAFGCQLPRPWDFLSPRCFDIATFWLAMGTIDILGDLALMILPAWVVWGLNMQVGRKVIVISAFLFRTLVIAAQIARLLLLQRWLASGELTYPIAYHIATTLQTALAVIVACIPALKPFRLMGVSLSQRGGTYDLSNDTPLQSVSKRSDATPKDSVGGHIFRADGSEHLVTISSSTKKEVDDDGSEKHMIQKTTDWDIQYSNPDQVLKHQASAADADDIIPRNGGLAEGHTVL